jgi:flagellar basal body-associated protein FliL
MDGTILVLLGVLLALAALTLVMWMWRGFLDMKEDDHLLLDEAESHLQREQAAIRAKVNSLSRYIKVCGVTWVVLAMVTVGAWIVTELKLI